MRVKVCGITRLGDARLAAELGASAIGFIFWPGSPRWIEPACAREIVDQIPPFVTTVGVFVDAPLEHVQAVAAEVRLGAVQLHGSESPEFCEKVGYRVVKAVPISPAFDPASIAIFPPAVTVLLDVHDPVRHGGTGHTIDWSVAAAIASTRRTILSGGLNAGNVEQAIDRVRPDSIDVSSGVEEGPGIKDPVRMREFFDRVGRRTVVAR